MYFARFVYVFIQSYRLFLRLPFSWRSYVLRATFCVCTSHSPYLESDAIHHRLPACLFIEAAQTCHFSSIQMFSHSDMAVASGPSVYSHKSSSNTRERDPPQARPSLFPHFTQLRLLGALCELRSNPRDVFLASRASAPSSAPDTKFRRLPYLVLERLLIRI